VRLKKSPLQRPLCTLLSGRKTGNISSAAQEFFPKEKKTLKTGQKRSFQKVKLEQSTGCFSGSGTGGWVIKGIIFFWLKWKMDQ